MAMRMAVHEHDKHELVLVDGEGQIVSVGRAIARRLRDRSGTYRLLPGPDGLLLFRREAASGGGAKVILSGEIGGPLGAVEMLQVIASTHLKGELVVVTGDVQRSIFLESGIVRMATSTEPSERLGEILSRFGVVGAEEIQKAMLDVGPEQRLGQILVDRGFLKQTDLYHYLQKQVEEIVYATTLVGSGVFMLLEGFASERWPAQVHLPAQAVLMESVRRMDELAYFRQRIPSSRVIPRAKTDGRAEGMDPEDRAFLALCDGTRTLEEVARLSALGEFEATKRLFHLLQKGAAETGGAPADEGERVGKLVDGFNDILAEILATAAATGRAEETREFLSTFLSGWGSYRELYEGAGPSEAGRFDRDRILGNLAAAQVSSRLEYLYQAFNEYLCFALFAAGSVLRRDEEKKLSKRIEDLLAQIRANQIDPSERRSDPGAEAKRPSGP